MRGWLVLGENSSFRAQAYVYAKLFWRASRWLPQHAWALGRSTALTDSSPPSTLLQQHLLYPTKNLFLFQLHFISLPVLAVI